MSAIPSFLKEASVSMILEQPFFAQIFYALENIELSNTEEFNELLGDKEIQIAMGIIKK